GGQHLDIELRPPRPIQRRRTRPRHASSPSIDQPSLSTGSPGRLAPRGLTDRAVARGMTPVSGEPHRECGRGRSGRATSRPNGSVPGAGTPAVREISPNAAYAALSDKKA